MARERYKPVYQVIDWQGPKNIPGDRLRYSTIRFLLTRRIMGQVNKKHFLEYPNVKFNPERTTRYLGFVRVGKYFIEWNIMKRDTQLDISVAWGRIKLAGRKSLSWILRRESEWAWRSSLTEALKAKRRSLDFIEWTIKHRVPIVLQTFC